MNKVRFLFYFFCTNISCFELLSFDDVVGGSHAERAFPL